MNTACTVDWVGVGTAIASVIGAITSLVMALKAKTQAQQAQMHAQVAAAKIALLSSPPS